MTENANIRGKQLVETTRGKSLGIILAFARTQVLLVNAVVVVAKLVHENVQEHKRPSLRFGKPARNAIV
jgi:hypothetical protein